MASESDDDSDLYIPDNSERDRVLDKKSGVEISRILGASTHYVVLEIDPNLDLNENEDTLRESYFEKSMLIDPVSCTHPLAGDAFTRLAEAYDTLNTPSKRQEYDVEIGKEVKRKRNSNNFGAKLNKLADALDEITEEQDIKPVNTPLRTVARGLLWLDRNVTALTRKRSMSDDSEEVESDVSDDMLDRNTSVYARRRKPSLSESGNNSEDKDDDQNPEQRQGSRRNNVRATRSSTIEEEWNNQNEAKKSSRIRVKDTKTNLRKLAQGFSNLDTVVSSYVALARAGQQQHRRHQRELAESRARIRQLEVEEHRRQMEIIESEANRRPPLRGLRLRRNDDEALGEEDDGHTNHQDENNSEL